MHLRLASVLCASVLLLAVSLTSSTEQRRFEYKYSFKPPFLTKDDGTIPFWSFGGHAIASDDSIRITPSLKNKRGWVWTVNATSFENWEVELSFRITGRGRIGADGIAIWYTDKPGSEGPVYGNADNWNGLGIFLDSYDNDQQHNNPAVVAVINDGQQKYDHDHDGSNQAVGSCIRDYRNKPSPVRVRVRLFSNRLSVWLTNGLSDKDNFEPCFESQELSFKAPKHGYFGVSAATGALADDHDVQYFLTHSLVDPNAKPAEAVQQENGTQATGETSPTGITDEERSKFEKEFEGFLEKLKAAKTEFEKEHGTAAAKLPHDNYENEADRNVRQILAMQSETVNAVRQIQNSLNTLSQTQAAAAAHPPAVAADPASTAVLAALPELARKNDLQLAQSALNTALTGLRNTVDEVQRRVQTNAVAPAPGGYDSQMAQTTAKRIEDLSHELSGALNSLRDEVHKLVRSQVQSQQAASQTSCSCASPTLLIVLAFLQLGLIVGFSYYQKSRETQAKKFY